MTSKVTAFIATYNRSAYLREAIQSVLNQTYEAVKIVVIDNGCTEHYAEKIVKSIDNPNVECVTLEKNIKEQVFNYAFDHTDTEYVICFHDDDIMFPWMIEEEVKILDENPDVGLVGCKALLSAGVIKIPDRPKSVTPSFYGHKEFVAELGGIGYNPLINSCVMFRVNDLNRNNLRYNSSCSSEDIHFWIRCNVFGDFKMCVIGEPLFQYRVHAASGQNWSVAVGVMEKSAAYVDGLLKKECPEIGAGRLREMFAIWTIMPAMKKYCRGLAGMDELLSERKRAEDQYGWFLPDWRFEDKLAVTYLEDTVLAVKAGKKSIGVYLDKVAEAEKLGIKVSLKRNKIWFGDSYIQV